MIKKGIKKYNELPVMVKVTFWSFFCGVLQKSVSLITLPLFTRLLTTEELGIVTSYNSWISIFLIFTSFKLNYGVFNKGMSQFPEERDCYVNTMQVITSVLTFVFFLVYLLFIQQFNKLTELPTGVMILMIIEMVFTPATWFWSLRDRYDFKYKAVTLVTITITLLNPIAGLISIRIWDQHAIARIVSSSLVNIVICASIFVLNIKRAKPKFSFKLAKFAFLFNLPLIPHYLSEYILDQSDRIMIQKMCSLSDLGLYGVAYNAGLVFKIIISSLNTALIPWLYRCLGDKKYDEIKKITDVLCLLLLLPLTSIMLVAPEVLGILAPVEYQSSIYVIPPVAASVYFVFLFGIYGNIEFFFDKNKFTMYISVAVAMLNIILNYIFINRFGYVAAAYTTLFCYFVLVLGHCIFVRKVTRKAIEKIVMNDSHIWIYSLFISVFAIIISLMYSSQIIRYVLLMLEIIILVGKRKKICAVIKSLK